MQRPGVAWPAAVFVASSRSGCSHARSARRRTQRTRTSWNERVGSALQVALRFVAANARASCSNAGSVRGSSPNGPAAYRDFATSPGTSDRLSPKHGSARRRDAHAARAATHVLAQPAVAISGTEGLLGPQEPLEGVAELCPPGLKGMASPIAVAVHFTTVFLECCTSPFDTCDLRDALKETRGRMADICVGLFVANAEPEPCLHRGALLSQPSKCIWLEPKRSRLTERSGKTCRIQQRNVRGGETAETHSTDQVPLCRKARDSCPSSAHDILGDEPGELRVTDVVRMPSRGPPCDTKTKVIGGMLPRCISVEKIGSA